MTAYTGAKAAGVTLWLNLESKTIDFLTHSKAGEDIKNRGITGAQAKRGFVLAGKEAKIKFVKKSNTIELTNMESGNIMVLNYYTPVSGKSYYWAPLEARKPEPSGSIEDFLA